MSQHTWIFMRRFLTNRRQASAHHHPDRDCLIMGRLPDITCIDLIR